MIDAIIKSLDDLFLGPEMDWVDKYGGLTETWTRAIDGPNDTTIQESVPVARGSAPGCGDVCRYHLAPDPANKKNVVFWTQETDAVTTTPANISRALRPVQYVQVCRLNVWLNFRQCGTCDSSSYLAYTQYLTALLHGREFVLSDPLGVKGKITLAGVPNKDFKEVWGEWTWGQEQSLFVHPFDFFALSFTFTWNQNQTCPIIPSC